MPVVERDRPGGQHRTQRQKLELSDGAGRVRRAKYRARCWGDAILFYSILFYSILLLFSFFTTYYTLNNIPTLTHSSHPTHRIVAAFALPLS